MPMWSIWLILSGFFFILEIFTVSFLLFWPAIGAFVAFLLDILGVESLTIQIGTFSVVSIVLIIFMKPLLKKFVKTNNNSTNIDSIIGKRGIVLKPIDNIACTGQVKVAGEIWSATNETDVILPVDTKIEVISTSGVKVKVKKI